MRALWHRENSRTRCQERILDLQSLPILTLLEGHQLRLDSTHRWEDLSMDLRRIAISTERALVMIWFSSSSAGTHESRLRQNCSCLPRKGTSYDLLLVVVNWLTKISKPMQMMSATETQSAPPRSGPRGTTFRLGCGYTPSSSSHASSMRKTSSSIPDSIKNLMTVCRKNLPHGLDIANPFPPDP